MNEHALSLLEALGKDLPKAIEFATRVAWEVSPSTAYERISEAALCSFRAHLQVGAIPMQWNGERIKALATRGPELLEVASMFSSPSHRPTRHTLILDVGAAHYALNSISPRTETVRVQIKEVYVPSPVEEPSRVKTEGTIPPVEKKDTGKSSLDVASKNTAGVWIDPKAIGRGPSSDLPPEEGENYTQTLEPELFRKLVRHHLRRLTSGPQGRTGQ